jgi:hypothetical protein
VTSGGDSRMQPAVENWWDGLQEVARGPAASHGVGLGATRSDFVQVRNQKENLGYRELEKASEGQEV